MDNYKPLGMTSSEYLLLDSKERKKLAARRSRERARALKNKEDLPPTIEEELGMRAVRPHASMRKEVEAEKKTYFDDDGTEMTRAEYVRKYGINRPMVKAGPVDSLIRTLRGMVHWIPGYDVGVYESEARGRGLMQYIPYFFGDKLSGKLYCKGKVESETIDSIRAILLASRGQRFNFGPPENL